MSSKDAALKSPQTPETYSGYRCLEWADRQYTFKLAILFPLRW